MDNYSGENLWMVEYYRRINPKAVSDKITVMVNPESEGKYL